MTLELTEPTPELYICLVWQEIEEEGHRGPVGGEDMVEGIGEYRGGKEAEGECRLAHGGLMGSK